MTIFPSLYAPPIIYFAYLYREQGREVLLEAQEHFVKQSLRNRCQILTANGVQTLSIPLEGGNKTKIAMADLRISGHDNWQKKHIQAIVSAYASSPFFEYYWDDIEPIYQEAEGQSLWAFNSQLTSRLAELIELDLDYQASQTFQHKYDEATLDLRYEIDRAANDKANSLLEAYPYYQVFGARYGFSPNLSIFDLIFNMGAESLLYLKEVASLL